MLANPQRPPIRLMDTTLRDGEQTPDVAFSADEKLDIVQLLLCEVGVDRVEICSARVSDGEQRAARGITELGRRLGFSDRVEALAFCDAGRSVRWLMDAGVEHMNLLVKGSERHCRVQLGQTLGEHLSGVEQSLAAAAASGLTLRGVYLEDWSRGVVDSPAYVEALVAALAALGVRRMYLADTLGVLAPGAVTRLVRRMCRRFPALEFEFHGHDDYGLATANALAAVRAGAAGLHVTVNGLGERAGNASLSEVVAALHDHAQRRTNVDEASLPGVAERVARASGYPIAHNAPVVGGNVFTQTAGVHADGDAKGGLYASRLAAERFGRRRAYALGKLSGRASLEHHLRQHGLAPSPPELEGLLRAVVACGDDKRLVRSEDVLRWATGATSAAGSVAVSGEDAAPTRRSELQSASPASSDDGAA